MLSASLLSSTELCTRLSLMLFVEFSLTFCDALSLAISVVCSVID